MFYDKIYHLFFAFLFLLKNFLLVLHAHYFSTLSYRSNNKPECDLQQYAIRTSQPSSDSTVLLSINRHCQPTLPVPCQLGLSPVGRGRHRRCVRHCG